MSPRNVGESILCRLKQLGVEYFFANPGTEFVSIIRGFADLPKESIPTPVLAPHEFLGVGMAYGYYLATKRPQAVMTHANVGAANALIGVIGAARMNIPILFISGMTSRSERIAPGYRDKLIHWSQSTADSGAMFREYMKWEAEITEPSQVFDVLDRAHAIAMSEPRGPVSIRIARDVLINEGPLPSPGGLNVVRESTSTPDPDALAQALTWLSSALRPIVITNRLGIDPLAVKLLADVSDRHAIGVLTPEDHYVSFPADHPNHLGFRPNRKLAESDFVLVLDTEVPWYPLDCGPPAEAKIVHVGPDPLFQTLPLRSHRGDLFIAGCPRRFLNDMLRTSPSENHLSSRREWIRKNRAEVSKTDDQALSPTSVGAVLSEFVGTETTLINELSIPPEALRCKHPGSYFRSGSASPLGWGVGCALGLGLADRNKTVIAGIGDGVFALSPIHAALLVSVNLELPFVIVILNNGGMASISKTVTEFYPGCPGDLPLTTWRSPDVALEKFAEAVSGIGIRVSSRNELRHAVAHAIEFCRKSKRPAIINAVLSDF